MLRAMMDIRAHPISLADRPIAAIWVTRSGCAGETVPHLLFFSQTSAGLYKATVVQHAPSDAGKLIGECRRDDVVMHAFDGSLKPPAEAVLGPICRPQQHDPSRLHEEHAEIAVPTLGNATEDDSIAGRDLSRHKPEPGTEVATAAERDPSPMVATMALAMIGPMPGTVISRWQATSLPARVSISPVT